MLILNQYKDNIINLDNITQIGIDNDNYRRILANIDEQINCVLGEYKTEERAKEVLEEIIAQNAMFELYKTLPTGGQEQANMLDRMTKKNILFGSYEMSEE